jgi:hypothetical protein
MTVPLDGQSRTPFGSNSAVEPKGGVALPGYFLAVSPKQVGSADRVKGVKTVFIQAAAL